MLSFLRAGNSFDREAINLHYLTSRSIDGLLISVASETKDFSNFKELHDRGMPHRFLRPDREWNTDSQVIVDNYKGAYDATRHLIENGYKLIAAIANNEVLSITKDRVAGYKAALADHGIKEKDSFIKYCEHGGLILPEIEKVITELMKLKPRPDAILALGDKLTTGSLRMLKTHNLNVPKILVSSAFSNSDTTELIEPPLSIIKQPAFEMGEIAATCWYSLSKVNTPLLILRPGCWRHSLLSGDQRKLKRKRRPHPRVWK